MSSVFSSAIKVGLCTVVLGSATACHYEPESDPGPFGYYNKSTDEQEGGSGASSE